MYLVETLAAIEGDRLNNILLNYGFETHIDASITKDYNCGLPLRPGCADALTNFIVQFTIADSINLSYVNRSVLVRCLYHWGGLEKPRFIHVQSETLALLLYCSSPSDLSATHTSIT